MSNITKFEGAKLPAHLNKFAALFGGNDALGKSGPTYPVLSIKGSKWHVIENKERTTLRNEDGDPLAAVQVVIVRANPNNSKVFYREGYEEGASDGAKPDCFSNDGIRPDSVVKEPEAKSCAACPHNVWGSGKEGKGRACGDSRRIAVAPENDLSKVMLLRVPAASLKPLGEYAALLSKKGVPYQAVVTRISFDAESSSPKLVFKPKDFLDEDAMQTVFDLQEDEIVKAIIGLSDAAAPEEHDDEPAPAPVKKAAKPAPVEDEDEPAPVKKPAAKAAKPAPVEDEDEPAPVKKAAKPAPVEDEDEPAPAKKPAAKAVASVSEDDLDSLLDDLDL